MRSTGTGVTLSCELPYKCCKLSQVLKKHRRPPSVLQYWVKGHGWLEGSKGRWPFKLGDPWCINGRVPLTSKLSLTGTCMWPSWGLTLIKLMSFLNTTSLRRAITKSYGFGTCSASNHCTTKSDRGTLLKRKRALIIWNSDVLGKREALEMIGGTLDGKGHPGSHITKHVSFWLLRHTGKAKHLIQSKVQGPPQGQAAKTAPSLLSAPDIQLQPSIKHTCNAPGFSNCNYTHGEMHE